METSCPTDILERLESAGANCRCYASNRTFCACEADWGEDCVADAATEIRRLRNENRYLTAEIQRLKKIDSTVDL